MTPKTGYVSRPPSDDPREVEAWALTEAARRLIDAGRSGDKDALRAALTLNQRLWTIFQAEMMEETCPLPAELRENVLVLSVIVDRQTMARFTDLDGTKLTRLVDINRNVAAGLMTRADAAATAGQGPAAAAPISPAAVSAPSRPMAPAYGAPRPAGAPAPAAPQRTGISVSA